MNRLAMKALRMFPALKPAAEKLVDLEARIAGRWASRAYRSLMDVQWSVPPQPEHFDHHINLHYQWHETRSSFWVERGVFSSLALRGGDVLDLCCGDGFVPRNFYAHRSRRVVACDFDQTAIRTARLKNSAPNVTYVQADIRTDMPAGTFDNVAWDGAIEHFTPGEMSDIFAAIRTRLAPGGIVSGYTIVEGPGGKALSHHEYEFKSKEDLLSVVAPHFKHARVFETIYPERHNLYFWASDGVLPFAPEWRAATGG